MRDIVDGAWAEPSGDADTVIGEGLWAVPGLVDAHAHLAGETLDFQPGVLSEAMQRARDALTSGVTLIIDKGWSDTTTIEVIREVPEDERPAIEAAARVIAVADGYYPGFALEIDPDGIVAAVVAEAKAGEGWVKLAGDWPRPGQGPVANFTVDQLRLAVEAAESQGSRVAIHAMARDAPSAAVEAGVHSIEHGLFLTEKDLEMLGERSGMWVPTILRTEAIVSQLGAESSGGRLLLEGLDNIQPLLPLALEAGVGVLAGTDLVGAPADVGEEALRLHQYGLSAEQALDTVTRTGFISTGRSDDFEIGVSADAVLFAANPLTDLGVLKHPKTVIRKGRVL